MDVNDTKAYADGHLTREQFIAAQNRILNASSSSMKEMLARVAELEALEPIAKVALRLDALWCEFEDMQYLDETMNHLYEACSVYRNRDLVHAKLEDTRCGHPDAAEDVE